MADKNTGDTYAGSGWQALLAQQVQAAVNAALERMNLGGWMQAEAPTRTEALNAIFKNRPDLQRAYAAEYKKKGDKAGDAYAYMERWIAKTTEKEISTDPAAYAQKMAWLPKGGQTPTLGREEMNLSREGQQAQYGLGYLQLLSQQRGPGDWTNYWSTVRNAQGSNLPGWAAALAGNRQIAPFQGQAGPNQPFTGFQGLPGTTGAATSGTAGAPATTSAAQAALARLTGAVANPQQQQAAMPSWYGNLPQINPLKVQPGQFNNLLPSEQAGLLGMIESQGGYSPDWLEQMRRAWPTGRASNRNVWG